MTLAFQPVAGLLAEARHNPADSPVGRFLTHPGLLLSRIAHTALTAAATWGPWAAPPLLLAVAAAFAAHARLGRRRRDRLAENARQVTILTPPQADPAGAEALWGYLTGLLRPAWKRLTAGQPHLSFEYAWTAAGMTISLWVPGTVPPGMAERAIEAAWPGARTASGPAVAALPDGALVTAGALRLARPDVLPLKAGHDADPLRALLGAAAGLPGGDRAVVQILARPATGGRLRRARRAARRIKAGQTATRAARVFDLLTHQPARTGTGRADPEHGAEVRAMVTKMASPQWEVAIRYAVATTAGDTPSLRGQLRGRAHSLASAFALYAGRNWLARQRLRHPEVINSRWMRRGGLLSVPELASLAHLPLDDAVPGLERAGARAVPPPPGVPATAPGVKPIGDTDAGAPRPAGLAVADARHHVHIIGATGSGKTTLLLNMVLADVAAGRGALVIDPKGDMITDLLARIPERAAGRVVLFDPDDDGPRPCLNVLDGPAPELVTDHLTGIFRRIYTDFWGPRTDDVFRSACLTLLHAGRRLHEPPTLADVPILLADAKKRRVYTGLLDDDVLLGFWSWYDGLSDAARAQVVGPLLNKLRAFLLRGFVRSAIAGGPSTVDMASVLNGGLCLVRLPKGILGDDTVQLLGSFIVAATWRAVSHRVRHDPAARRDAALYLDECQNFLMLPHGLPDMLAEARAYRLSLVLAHQDLAQLPRELREGISANARSKIFFSCSPEDARDLQRHTSPTLTAHDLSHLGLYQAAARLVVAGQETPAFTLRTRRAAPAAAGRAELIRRAAREAYGLSGDRLQQAQQGRDPREKPA
jgi:TraM recognition site of TraD and TraG/Type IV secretion-system coupling protein DNA-binding domain